MMAMERQSRSLSLEMRDCIAPDAASPRGQATDKRQAKTADLRRQ